MHVHVIRAEGEAKFWLEPEKIVEEHQNEFRAAWHQHFGS